MNQPFEQDIERLVETLKSAKARNSPCALLIGAGVSVSAGIPLASDIVKGIESKYPAAYSEAQKISGKELPSYGLCMDALSYSERLELIQGYIQRAKINWAHLAIAQLIKHDYVGRILSTNFDPLVQRACAMLNEFPAVYDVTTTPEDFNAKRISPQAVFHLHGLHTGFSILNTQTELENASKRTVKKLFDDTVGERVLIVVGYSGENDSVFKQFEDVRRFEQNLYWVVRGEKNEKEELVYKIPAHIQEKLLKQGKGAYWVKGEDGADSFFVELAKKLDCFPPLLFKKPFSHLMESLDAARLYNSSSLGLFEMTKAQIQKAIDAYEQEDKDDKEESSIASELLRTEKYSEVIKNYSSNPNLNDYVAWAHVIQGDVLLEQAKSETGFEADSLFEQAYGQYKAARDTNPKMQEALYNWGNALFAQAKQKQGAAADALFEQAYEKYAQALKIKPDKHEALINWGYALSTQAQQKQDAAADELFEQAYEKYAQALKIKPDVFEALFNWGCALDDQAQRSRDDDEADELFKQAYEKYEQALKVKPSKFETLANWGLALKAQASRKSGKEAETLLKKAEEKFAQAKKIQDGNQP